MDARDAKSKQGRQLLVFVVREAPELMAYMSIDLQLSCLDTSTMSCLASEPRVLRYASVAACDMPVPGSPLD